MGTEKQEEVIEVTATEEHGEVAGDKATDVQETQDGKAGDQGQEAEHQDGEHKDDAGAGAKKPDDAKAKAEAAEREKNKKFARERIEKRNRERRLELENAELKGKLKAVEEYGLKKPEQAAAPKAEDIAAQFVKANPKPRAEDFETAADHTEAVADWTYRKNDAVKSGLAEAKETETRQTTAKTEQDRAQQAFEANLDAKKAKGEEKYEDFEEVVSAAIFEPPTLAAIAVSEAGEDVAYYLANNPAEIVRISKLAPILQAKEVGRIELGLETGKLQIKKTTAAAPPARTVAGNAPTKIDESKLSDQEWYKRKQKTNSA